MLFEVAGGFADLVKACKDTILSRCASFSAHRAKKTRDEGFADPFLIIPSMGIPLGKKKKAPLRML